MNSDSVLAFAFLERSRSFPREPFHEGFAEVPASLLEIVRSTEHPEILDG